MPDRFAIARPNSPSVSPDHRLVHLFSSDAAIRCGVVRCKARDVERLVGWPRFREKLHRRGYRPLVNGGQVAMACNAGHLCLLDCYPPVYCKKLD